MLNEVHADSVLVTGTTTSGCVRASVIDMAMKYADVISLNEATDYIRGLPDNLYAPAL
jgi:nicotinamidase-related amidase